MTYLDRARQELQKLRDEHRYRELPERQLTDVIDFSSNDYLGMSTEPQVLEALKHAKRAGSGGARLLAGRNAELTLLEEELADWLGRERALLFSSGYLAATGAIPVLAQLVDEIQSDRSNHASLIDGIRLARRPHAIYDHGALPPRDGTKSRLVVSETLFSMDGDTIDGAALLETLGESDVLLLDEAHAIGILGADGAGLARELTDPRVVVLGTLSKALGALGGFIVGPSPIVELLVNRARTFIFDTALPPALALAARIALHLTRSAEERRARLRANVRHLRAALGVAERESPIVPILLDTEERALEVSKKLMERRIYVPAIRPPTVPVGTSRLRISVRAAHTPEQLDLLAAELRRCIATS